MNNLNNKDHDNMDVFVGSVLDAYKNGEIVKEEAIGHLTHVISAIDNGNISEARTWFEQGRKLIR